MGAFIGGFGSRWAPEALLVFLAGLLVCWQGVEFLVRCPHLAADRVWVESIRGMK